MGWPKGQPRKAPKDRREDIETKFEESRGSSIPEGEGEKPQEQPEKQEVEAREEQQMEPLPEEKVEEEQVSEEKPEEKPKRKWAGKFDSEEDLERGYTEAEKKMHESTQKASQYEQEFAKLKNYIDWNRLKADISGIPVERKEPPVQNAPAFDKEKFLQDFTERGPEALTPYMRNSLQQELRQVVPILAQNVAFRVKVEDAYSTFRDEYPHLDTFEEAVGKMMFEDLTKNPRKNVTKAMRDAAKEFQKILDGYKEEGKKESQTLHTEKKGDNLPPGDRASRDRIGFPKPKIDEEEKPETIQDIINQRKNFQRKTSIGIGSDKLNRR